MSRMLADSTQLSHLLWEAGVRNFAKGNPCTLGFYAEMLCLSRIQLHGITLPSAARSHFLSGRTFNFISFDEVPNFSEVVARRNGNDAAIFIPNAFNHPYVDAALVYMKKNYEAHVYPIQITISKQHSDSESLFNEKLKGKWAEENKLYKTVWHFIWICPPVDRFHIMPHSPVRKSSDVKPPDEPPYDGPSPDGPPPTCDPRRKSTRKKGPVANTFTNTVKVVKATRRKEGTTKEEANAEKEDRMASNAKRSFIDISLYFAIDTRTVIFPPLG